MEIKKLLAVYFSVSASVVMIKYIVGLTSIDQVITQLIMLAIPFEINILTLLPNILGVIAVFVYFWLSEK